MPCRGCLFYSLFTFVFVAFYILQERQTMTKTIAICDQDHEYARHLAMHMLREERVPYEPRLYRSVEELQ